MQIRSATFEIGVTWKVDGITREREREGESKKKLENIVRCEKTFATAYIKERVEK